MAGLRINYQVLWPLKIAEYRRCFLFTYGSIAGTPQQQGGALYSVCIVNRVMTKRIETGLHTTPEQQHPSHGKRRNAHILKTRTGGLIHGEIGRASCRE